MSHFKEKEAWYKSVPSWIDFSHGNHLAKIIVAYFEMRIIHCFTNMDTGAVMRVLPLSKIDDYSVYWKEKEKDKGQLKMISNSL